MTIADRFAGSGPTDSADHAAAVTPHDSTNFSSMTRALYVGAAGDVTVVMKSGAVVTFVDVPAGTILPVRCSRVNDTGADADLSIVALF